MPRIKYTPPGIGGRRKPIPRSFTVPRANLSRYNAARRAGYQPRIQRPITSKKGPGAAKRASRRGRAQQTTPLVRYTGASTTKAAYQAPKADAYGRPLNTVDPALLQRVMNSQPNNLSGAFEKYDMYQGEDFINYLYNEGIVPHFTTQGLQGVPRSGRWTDYLLTKMGITSYGVNPYALPYPQEQQPASYGGYGGYGGGGGGGGAAYTPPEPKQYGSTSNRAGYNPADWLKEMVVWNI